MLFTGGDPLVMKSSVLRSYIEPLLACEQLTSIRIGTKSMSFWPYRFLTDPDADDLMRLFERALRRSGLPLRMTEGYNPHPVIAFPTALGLGIDGQPHAPLDVGEHLEGDVERIAGVFVDADARSLAEGDVVEGWATVRVGPLDDAVGLLPRQPHRGWKEQGPVAGHGQEQRVPGHHPLRQRG